MGEFWNSGMDPPHIKCLSDLPGMASPFRPTHKNLSAKMNVLQVFSYCKMTGVLYDISNQTNCIKLIKLKEYSNNNDVPRSSN